MTDDELATLRKIRLPGSTEEHLAEDDVDGATLQRLIADGLVAMRPIEMQETQAPGVAAPTPIRVWYLTPAGASALGEDPQRIGLA